MKLEIIKGKEFNAEFTVVSSDGITPEVLDISDTGVFLLSTTGINPKQVITPIDLVAVDRNNGKFKVTIPANVTSTLQQFIGSKEDKYPTISGHIATLDLDLVSGNRVVTVDVYVRDIGL